MNWLTENWFKEHDEEGNYNLRQDNPKYGNYIGKIQNLDIADHIVWIHNCLVDAHRLCKSAEGTHMLRYGVPVHQENGKFYPCVLAIFGSTQEALIEMYNK